MLAVVVGAASPVLFGLVEPFIPYPVWAGLFVAMLAAVAISMMGSPGGIWPSLVFGSGVVASWALLLTTIGSADSSRSSWWCSRRSVSISYRGP